MESTLFISSFRTVFNFFMKPAVLFLRFANFVFQILQLQGGIFINGSKGLFLGATPYELRNCTLILDIKFFLKKILAVSVSAAQWVLVSTTGVKKISLTSCHSFLSKFYTKSWKDMAMCSIIWQRLSTIAHFSSSKE